jgi:hypothetical protein
MYALFNSLLQYFWLPGGTPAEEIQGNQYVSITKYTELKHPVKCNGSYVDTFKAKNYHYYFDQSITRFSQKSK